MEEEMFAGRIGKKREVMLFDVIDEDTAGAVVQAILELNAENSRKEIIFHIRSDGGCMRYALEIYDAIRLSRAPVVGIAYGKVYSGALLVLQACRKRLAIRESYFLLHFGEVTATITNLDLSNELPGIEIDAFAILRAAEECRKIMLAIIERSGIPAEKILQLAREGSLLSSNEALEFGLIDKIIKSGDEIKS